MQKNGFNVIMVSSEGKEWPDLIANEKCQHRIVHMTRKITPFADLVSLWNLYRLFKKERPDIVHSHTPKAGLLAMLAAKLAGVKIRIHTVAGLRFMTANGFKRKLLVFMEKLTASSAQHVWPNSLSLQQYIINNKLADPKKLQIIGKGSSNGIDLNRYSAHKLDPAILESVKKQINYDPSLKYILNMGRIVKDKGINEVMQVFKQIHEEYPDTRLVVLGSFEDDLDPISEEARKILTTHPAIIHIEWSDQVEYFQHLADLLVHASYREGFPNTLLQAGAMNCPIVCSAIEGSVDIVTDKETGLLFEVANASDLLEKWRYAMSHPEEMENYAVSLRHKIEEQFSQEYLHRCMKEKYLELLSNKP